MNPTCHCKPPRHGQGIMKVLSAVFSSMALILMPKCPLCLAAYVTLLTGLSMSTKVASQLHTGLFIVCICMLTPLLWWVWKRAWRSGHA